jgi:hypothetical protein
MPSRPATRWTLAALLVAIAAWAAAPARALDDTKPGPGCAGLAFADPSGDQVDPFGTAPANLDVTGGFFKYDGSTTTANIRIADLNQDVPAYATGIDWYFVYTGDSTTYYVEASVDFTGTASFGYGTYDTTNGYTEADSMPGKFFNGRDGVIQLAVPNAVKGGEGNVLRDPYVDATESYSVPGVGGFVQSADDGPDSLSGHAYTVGSCEAGETNGVRPANAPGRTSTLRIKLLSKRATAARARKGRTLALRLRSTERVTRLAARITSGSTTHPVVYGTGRLKRISGRATLHVHLRRSLHRGSYRLDLTGIKAHGKRGSRSLHLAVH